MTEIFEWAMQDTTNRLPILVALIGVVGAIVGGAFTVIIWPLIKRGMEISWDKTRAWVSGRGFEYRYLDWVIGEHRYLPILPTTLVPVTERKIHAMERVYVSLTVKNESGEQERLELGEALAANPRLVILGDPGAGKTTMLRYLSLTLARARRNKPFTSKEETPDEERKNNKRARHTVKDNFRFGKCPLPVFVYLNRLRDVEDWGPGRSLLDVIRGEWQSTETLREFPSDFFEKKLRSGECIFLLDAFDELGSHSARTMIADHIGQLAAGAPPGNRFILTSRIAGYSGQLSRYGFEVLTIQRLTWDLISQLARKWYDALGRQELTDQLLSTLRSNPRIYELAVNPMLLSLIVLVQYIRRLIPDRRDVLYDECIKILVERRYAPPDVQESYNSRVPGEEAVRILRELAFAIHTERLRDVERRDLEENLIPSALRTMPNSRAARLAASEILENIEDRSQLLVERGFNDKSRAIMAFSHLTFQEYLAAVALKEYTGREGELAVSDRLLKRYQKDPEWWEEVALLYAAQLDGPQQQSFLHKLYPPKGKDAEE